MPLGTLLYETADIGYDTVTKNYVNPKDNSVYGSTPPVGGWPVTWYMDTVSNKPVVVSGNQTVEQITAQLAQQNVVTASDAGIKASSFLSGKTFGIDNTLLVGGAVVGILIFMSNGR